MPLVRPPDRCRRDRQQVSDDLQGMCFLRLCLYRSMRESCPSSSMRTAWSCPRFQGGSLNRALHGWESITSPYSRCWCFPGCTERIGNSSPQKALTSLHHVTALDSQQIIHDEFCSRLAHIGTFNPTFNSHTLLISCSACHQCLGLHCVSTGEQAMLSKRKT